MQDEADQVDDGAEQGADDSGLLLADLGSQHGGQRGHDEQRSNGRAHGHSGLGGGVLEVVGEDVGVHAGHGEHGQQQAQSRQNDAQQGTAGENALEQGHGLELLGLGGDDDALGGQAEAEDVADNGADAEQASHHNHAAAAELRNAVDGLISEERGGGADDQVGQGGADAAEGGQLGAVVGLGRNGGSHRAVGDVDGGVEHGAPQQVGDEHPHDLEGHGHAGELGLIDQEGGDGHRAAHPLDPGTEPAVLGGLGAVHDLAHGHVGEGVHKAGHHHQQADDCGGHAHDVGVEHHHKAGRKHEGEIVAEVTEHIAELVPHAEGAHGRTGVCHRMTLLFCWWACPRGTACPWERQARVGTLCTIPTVQSCGILVTV